MKKFKFRPDYNSDGVSTPTNGQRATWAANSVRVFASQTDPKSPQLEPEHIQDLICDLLHLADREGFGDPEEIVRFAIANWKHERH